MAHQAEPVEAKMIVAGLVVAILTLLVAILSLVFGLWNPFKKKPEPVEVIVKEDLSANLQVNFFPTNSPAFELRNSGTAEVSVTHVIISTELIEGATTEPYRLPSPVSIPRGKPQLMYINRYARKYFDTQMKEYYETGREPRRPTIRVSFRCEFSDQHFDTKWQSLVAKFENGTLVDLKPPDTP